MVLLITIFVQVLSVFATSTDYCTLTHMSDAAGYPGIVVTCQSGN